MALTDTQQANLQTGLSVLQSALGALQSADDSVVVVEEPPTFFELYGPWLVGAGGLLALLAILRK